MVRQNLLQDQAAEAQFMSLIPDLSDEASNLQEVCSQLDQLGTFDVVILGMGGCLLYTSPSPRD